MHLLIDSADAYDKLSARWSGCTSTTVVHHHQTGRLSLAHVARPGRAGVRSATEDGIENMTCWVVDYSEASFGVLNINHTVVRAT